MALNSCIYECEVYHVRLWPRHHAFKHRMFMFCVDLNELDTLPSISPWLGVNAKAPYEFRDSDHLHLNDARSTKEKLHVFLKQKGIQQVPASILLITHFRTLGYIFNPVSFYFCYDEYGLPICAVAEVSNTYREMKLYLLGPETFKDGIFSSRQTKFFYISPFMDMDTTLEFILPIPSQVAHWEVNDLNKEGEFILYAGMRAKKHPLTHETLVEMSKRYWLVTLRVIFFIHFHALLLHLKKVPHWGKKDHPELQKERIRVYGSK